MFNPNVVVNDTPPSSPTQTSDVCITPPVNALLAMDIGAVSPEEAAQITAAVAVPNNSPVTPLLAQSASPAIPTAEVRTVHTDLLVIPPFLYPIADQHNQRQGSVSPELSGQGYTQPQPADIAASTPSNSLPSTPIRQEHPLNPEQTESAEFSTPKLR